MKRRPAKERKTRFVGYAAISIDGRISLSKTTRPDWTSKEDWQFLQKELARADAVIVGRNTYRAAAARLRTRTTFVLTSRVETPVKKDGVTFVNPAKTNLRALFAPYKRVAILGGAGVYRHMIEHGYMDELFLTIEPLVFGRGTPMVTGGTKIARLSLVSVKRMNRRGTLLLHYRRP